VSTLAAILVVLGITAVLCYVAIVSLSDIDTLLGMIAFVAVVWALAWIASILAARMQNGQTMQELQQKRRSGWWDRLL
jgi:membrane protein implicated in regulation of membrane protease activity